jgi:hypothetical protein
VYNIGFQDEGGNGLMCMSYRRSEGGRSVFQWEGSLWLRKVREHVQLDCTVVSQLNYNFGGGKGGELRLRKVLNEMVTHRD